MSDVAAVFTQIFQQHLWGSESRSGIGSTPQYTKWVSEGLSYVIRELRIGHVLDIPCGDGVWIRPIAESLGIEYHGADIVPDLVNLNASHWPQNEWHVFDICTSDLPCVDLIFVRDCLVHLPLDLVFQALRNIQRSGSEYLMMTTFPGIPEGNTECGIGSWRRLDFQAPPFRLPPPLLLVNECRDGPSLAQDKSLGVWRPEEFRL